MNAQQLKNSILQMAVQGKLVPQDPNDEPASVLLERIRAEKEKLIKEGKIKKEKNPSYIFRGEDNLPYEKVGKNDPVCIADEVPFEIPETWEWVRLKELASVLGGKRIPAGRKLTTNNTGHFYIRVSDMKNGSVLTDNLLYVPEDIYPSISKYIIKKEDLYITVAGTIGMVGKIPPELDGANLTENADRLVFKILNQDWLMMCLSSGLVQKQIADATTKVGQPKLAIKRIEELLISLPPLEEQKRIVARVNSVTPFLQQYQNKNTDICNLNASFPNALKKSILQQAVMGKLVPQDPNDEPASVLLEKIRAEKDALIKAGRLKKDKHESIIYRRDNSHYEKLDGIERCIDDEILFDIPDTWVWVRLGTIFQHNTGKPLNTSNHDGKSLTYITTSNLYWNRFELNNLRQMFFTESEIGKCTVTKGDLLVCEGGDIGRAAIWMYDYDVRIQNHIHRLRAYVPICAEYFYFLFFLYKNSGVIGGKGIGIQGLSSNSLHNILFPLPPLNEQYRIVEAINSSMIPLNML